MNIINFSQEFRRKNQKYLGTTDQGIEDFLVLDRKVMQFPHRSTILLDISGFELFGYSYAKQTIRRMLRRAKSGEYGSRYFALLVDDKEGAEEVHAALAEDRLALLASTSPTSFYDEYFLVGDLNEVMKKSLEYIIRKKEVTSGVLQRELSLESVQAASNRISRLAAERLVVWEPSENRTRNVLSCRRLDL